jgi:UDP-glucose 4-epimerase
LIHARQSDRPALWRGLKVLVTGGTGFIGQRLIESLSTRGADLNVLTRRVASVQNKGATVSSTITTGDLTDARSLVDCCVGIHTVFHLAGYAHATDQDSAEAKRLHWETTVEGTRALLEAAVGAGVRQFIFLSSVKVMGEGGEDCLDESAATTPDSHYGRAKLEAERLVFAAGRQHGMHVCVLRLPLVYGPGNKGNIPRMIEAIDRGRFPPLPEVHNRRSMVHVDDVVQALLLAAEQPAANGQVYIVSDERVYSTRNIYVAICQALGRRVPAWSVPAWLLRAGAGFGDALERVTGRRMPVNRTTLEKLLGSAWYNSEKISRELGFRPSHTLYDALPEMIVDYRASALPAMVSSG